jgi:flagellar hook-basal body complex protein FliE
MAIESLVLSKVGASAGVKPAAVAAPAAGESAVSAFSDGLEKLVKNAEESGATANEAVSNMMNKTGDVHDAMIALQRAEMSLQFTVQVRNKLVQAYNDIMRMPV